MMKKLLSIVFLLIVSYAGACDGMSYNIVSNTYIGGGIYELEIEYCERVSNSSGTDYAAVYGVWIQVNGANIVGTSTPSLTSNAQNVTINYNHLGGNTAEWGDWSDESLPPFLDYGDAQECFTIIIQVDAPTNSVTVAGSSSDTNVGGGFVPHNGRYGCVSTDNPPTPVCDATWTPVEVCEASTDIINLDDLTFNTGAWSGPGVVNGTLDPQTITQGGVNITFTVGDAQFNCESTQTIATFPVQDPDFWYTDRDYCVTDAPVTPNFVETPGGTFFIDNGGFIDPATGEIDPSNMMGAYVVTYQTPDQDCGATDTFNIEVHPKPVVNFINNQEMCAGVSTAAVNFGSDTPNSTFNWTNNEGDIGLNLFGTGNIGAFPSANNSAAPVTSTISVTATSEYGCTSDPVDFDITVNPVPTVSAGPDQVICNGDQVTLSAQSAFNGTYVWTPGNLAGASVTTTPTGSVSNTVTQNYVVTITDINTGCEGSDDMDVLINPCVCIPPAVTVSDAEICDGQNIDLNTLVGGDPNHNGSWYTSVLDANNGTNAVAPVVTVGGNYYYRYEEQGDPTCFGVGSINLTVNANPTPSFNIISIECDGVTVGLEVAQDYVSYNWNTGNADKTDTVDISLTNPVSVTVIDGNSCQGTADTNLASIPVLDLVVDSYTDPSCPGKSDGSIVLSATGGALPYTFSWDNGAAVTSAQSQLQSGTYKGYVMDANGCIDSVEQVLNEPPALTGEVTTVDATCFGYNDGGASVVNIQGAQGAITYIWSTNSPNPNSVDNVNNLYAGHHAVQLFDEKGCNYLIQFSVYEPDELRIEQFGVDSLSYCRGSGLYPGTGYASGIAVGGTGTPTYSWTDSTGAVITNTATAQDLVPGDYTLTVVDANGCMASETLYMDSINPRADFDVTPQQGEAPLDVLITDVSDGLAANGVLYWTLDTTNQTGQFTTTVSGSRDTVYTDWGDYVIELIVENGYGCRDTIYKTVNVFRPLDIMPPNVFTPDGDGNNDVFYIPVEGWSEYSIVVFDRWGLKLFETNDPNIGWNGKVNNDGQDVTEGVYFYTYRIVGENVDDVREGRGNIHVIR